MIERSGPVDSGGYRAEDFLIGVLTGAGLNGTRDLGNNLAIVEGLEAAVRKADELKIPLGFGQITNLHIANAMGQVTHIESNASCMGGRSWTLNFPDSVKAKDYLIKMLGVSYAGRRKYVEEFRQLGLAFKEVFDKVGV